MDNRTKKFCLNNKILKEYFSKKTTEMDWFDMVMIANIGYWVGILKMFFRKYLPTFYSLIKKFVLWIKHFKTK